MRFTAFWFFGILTFVLNAQTDNAQTVIFSNIGELSDEQLNNSGAVKLHFITDKAEAESMAQKDIQNGTPFLLLMGGIAPVVIATDPEFEKK